MRRSRIPARRLALGLGCLCLFAFEAGLADAGNCNVCDYGAVEAWRSLPTSGTMGFRSKLAGGGYEAAPSCLTDIELDQACPTHSGNQSVGDRHFWKYKGSLPACDTTRAGAGLIKMKLTLDVEELNEDGTQYACSIK